MIELELKEVQSCLGRISQLANMQEKEYAGDLNAQRKQITVLEEEKRRLNAQVNDLVIASGKHEKENMRMLFAGFISGLIVGAMLAVIWISYL